MLEPGHDTRQTRRQSSKQYELFQSPNVADGSDVSVTPIVVKLFDDVGIPLVPKDIGL
jgi:hypothetical protein